MYLGTLGGYPTRVARFPDKLFQHAHVVVMREPRHLCSRKHPVQLTFPYMLVHDVLGHLLTVLLRLMQPWSVIRVLLLFLLLLLDPVFGVAPRRPRSNPLAVGTEKAAGSILEGVESRTIISRLNFRIFEFSHRALTF